MRRAALIADPGTWSIADGFRDVIVHMFGIAPEVAKDLGALEQSLIERLDSYIRGNRQLNWKVVQRGFWVHGVDNLREYDGGYQPWPFALRQTAPGFDWEAFCHGRFHDGPPRERTDIAAPWPTG